MQIFKEFRQHANPENAAAMKAYMRGQFEYLGIRRPERNVLQKAFLTERKKENYVDTKFIKNCWEQPEREFQHLAMDYYRMKIRHATIDQIDLMHYMITTKSWWDTVDFIAAGLVGPLVASFPSLKGAYLRKWIESEDLWLRRTSLLFQLKYHGKTDTAFLRESIEGNLGSREFFINKAIGWALRQYSKTNPDWVRQFIQSHTLAPLSMREGSKYL